MIRGAKLWVENVRVMGTGVEEAEESVVAEATSTKKGYEELYVPVVKTSGVAELEEGEGGKVSMQILWL